MEKGHPTDQLLLQDILFHKQPPSLPRLRALNHVTSKPTDLAIFFPLLPRIKYDMRRIDCG